MLDIRHLKWSPLGEGVIRDIDLHIDDGKMVVVTGPNGGGKTSLAKLIAGINQPTGGHIYFNGEDIDTEGYDKKLLRSKVGLVFQYPEHQLFETDVFSDVCFGPKNLGLSKKEVELRAYEALKLVGLEDEYFYQSPFDLSGGQKRRVAIAGVLAMKPEVLVLDEPTAALSEAETQHLFAPCCAVRPVVPMTSGSLRRTALSSSASRFPG